MNRLFTRMTLAAGMALAPSLAFAQGSFNTTISTLTDSINTVILFLFVVATVIFLWGMVRYVSAAGDEEKTKEARQMIIWGVIFLAVMIALWGFVNVVLDFIFNSERPFDIPGVGDVPKQN